MSRSGEIGLRNLLGAGLNDVEITLVLPDVGCVGEGERSTKE
jgi:hypothetical protein